MAKPMSKARLDLPGVRLFRLSRAGCGRGIIAAERTLSVICLLGRGQKISPVDCKRRPGLSRLPTLFQRRLDNSLNHSRCRILRTSTDGVPDRVTEADNEALPRPVRLLHVEAFRPKEHFPRNRHAAEKPAVFHAIDDDRPAVCLRKCHSSHPWRAF